jgi:hypothetical protein
MGVRGGAVGWGTALQAGRSQVIPDGVIWISQSPNPSRRTMALASTQTQTDMSTRNISWRVNASGAKG